MANEPKPAAEKRPEPPKRQNAQGDGEGSAHDPSEFASQNPATPGGTGGEDKRGHN